MIYVGIDVAKDNQSVPVCSILSEVRTQMTCRVVHLHFFLSSKLHSINAASEK